MRYVVSGHRRHGEDGYRPRAFEVDGFFVAGSELTVQVAGITAVRRNLFLRDRDFFHRVGEVRHIGQKDEHVFALQRKLFGDGKAQIGHFHAFDRRVGGRVDKHNGAAHRSAVFERVFKVQVIVVL